MKNQEEFEIMSRVHVILIFRSGLLTRHRSMTESSQTLRQVEMPKKITRAVRRDRDFGLTLNICFMVTLVV